jgi:hypothetical protein
MAGLVKLRCDNWARDEWPVWAASRPYKFALNSGFSAHNYTFREKRFERGQPRTCRKATVPKVQLRQLKQDEYKMGLARLWLRCQE